MLKGGEGLSRTMPAMPGRTEAASEPVSVIPEERQLELFVDNADCSRPTSVMLSTASSPTSATPIRSRWRL